HAGSAADVRFGSLADIARPRADVRFTPKSGHRNRHVYQFRRDNSGSLAIFAAIRRASSLLSALSGSVKKDSGPYRFPRTIARADFMLASLPSIISVRWKISPLTTAVLFTVTRLAWRVPLT